MDIVGRIILGLIIAAVGVLLVIKVNWFVNNFGRIAWAERVLGIFGGTRTVIKLIGLIAILIGFVTMTGQQEAFLQATVGWLVPGR